METFKKYLPWIIAAAVGLYLVNRFRGGRTVLAPQTQFTQEAQPDALAALRGQAFEALTRLGIAESESAADIERSRIAGEVELAKSELSARAYTTAANLEYSQREQDRRTQQSAIDRYYSSRNTQAILGSVNTALSGIFGNRGGSVFGTPPTFPRFG